MEKGPGHANVAASTGRSLENTGSTSADSASENSPSASDSKSTCDHAMEPISNMFSAILNNERRHKHDCIVYPASKLMGQVLRVMQKYGYVGEFEFVDDGRGGKFKIQLLGRVNNCGSVRPRFSSTVPEFEKWGKRYLPSRDVGILIVTTPKGVVAHKEAREMASGGLLLGYVY